MQAATTAKKNTTPAKPHPRRLSPRMLDVLALLASGLTHDQVAERLGISPSAVKTYLASAKRRLGVRTRNEAIVAAVSSGLVSLTGE
jgi:DNA-binding NarL/FixJ family response regulator